MGKLVKKPRNESYVRRERITEWINQPFENGEIAKEYFVEIQFLLLNNTLKYNRKLMSSPLKKNFTEYDKNFKKYIYEYICTSKKIYSYKSTTIIRRL